jgi:hypothetical protein
MIKLRGRSLRTLIWLGLSEGKNIDMMCSLFPHDPTGKKVSLFSFSSDVEPTRRQTIFPKVSKIKRD